MNDAYLKTKNEVLNEYKTSMDGLSSKEARRRQGIQGKNVLIEKNKKSKLSIFFKTI